MLHVPRPHPNSGSTPALLWAVMKGEVEISEMLLDAGADANSVYYGFDDADTNERLVRSDGGFNWTVLKEATRAGNVDLVDILLDREADTNIDMYSDDEYITPLYLAVKGKHAKIAEMLLEQGAEVDMESYLPVAIGIEHGTPLTRAVHDDNFELAKMLLNYGADPDAGRWTVWDCIHELDGNDPSRRAWEKLLMSPEKWKEHLEVDLVLAARRGEIDNVRQLIAEGVDVNSIAEDGRIPRINIEGDTPLSAAAAVGHAEVVKMLLAARANPNATTVNDWTALMRASANGRLETVKILLAGKANQSNWPALVVAARNGHAEVAKVLMDAGANPNERDKFGNKPLTVASDSGHAEIVEMLLDGKADPNSSDTGGWTALMSASKNGHAKIVKMLLDGGADPCATYRKGNTALDYATKGGHTKVKHLLELALAPPKRQENCKKGEWFYTVDFGDESEVQLLLDEGADVNETGGNGNTALMAAARCGRLEILKLLMSGKAKLNLADNNGMTALMVAASNGHAEIVKALLDAGAKPDIADKDEKTAWDIACARGYTKVAKTLQDGGADPFAGKDDVGFVYLAINETMPGLVKIGMTKVDVDERIKELSRTTSVPTPFECAYSVKVVSPKQVEESLHEKYDFCRVRDEREFFKIDWRAVELYLEEKYSLLSHSRESGNLPNL